MEMPKIYTRQELIDELLRYERENGRIPTRDDIASTRGYPPIRQYYREFKGFKNALMATSFVTKQIIDYTRDILIKEALRYEEEFQRIPSYSGMQNAEGYPPTSAYLIEFGLWKNVLNEVPFKNQEEIKRREVKVYSDQELKDFLLKRYDEIGRIPEADDLVVSLGYPCADVYSTRYGLWSSIKKEVFYNKEWLTQYLLQVKEKLGRLPRCRDMKEYKGFVPVTVIEEVFGSWNNAMNEIFYTNEYMQNELIKFENEHGRTPITTDFQHVKGQIPYHRIEKISGSWRKSKYSTPFETTIDHSFFNPENMNLKKWYIVGYIIGDGCVSDSGQIIITSTEKDKSNLYDMYKNMNIDTSMVIKQIEGCQTSYSISKFSPQWIESLRLYGIIPRKSLVSSFPLDYLKTPEEQAAIMRGLFDSDGSINYRSTAHGFEPVFFICGSKQCMDDCSYFLEENCGFKPSILKHSNIFRIQIYGIEKCQAIYDFLYGHENFYIKRKKERFEKLINGTFAPENDVY